MITETPDRIVLSVPCPKDSEVNLFGDYDFLEMISEKRDGIVSNQWIVRRYRSEEKLTRLLNDKEVRRLLEQLFMEVALK